MVILIDHTLAHLRGEKGYAEFVDEGAQGDGGALTIGRGTNHQDRMFGIADRFAGLHQCRIVRRGPARVFGG